MATGMSEPSTFSNRRARPPRAAAGERSSSSCPCGAGVLQARSVISEISRIGDTLVLMRTSSLFLSSKARKSEKVAVGMSRMVRQPQGKSRSWPWTHLCGYPLLMRRRPLQAILIIFFFIVAPLRAAEPKINPSDFIWVQDGHLPLILSAPHGGDIRIPGIAERKGEGLQRGGAGFAIVRDSNTEELAHALSDAIEAKF